VGEEKFHLKDERRIMIPSPKVATYDLQPEMERGRSKPHAIIPEIEKESADFICLNYANADMVGHTGIWQAAIKAVETVDHCVERVVISSS
jgi:2,3-bisphosphoglycerate-independent phosphoglycerate mutase